MQMVVIYNKYKGGKIMSFPEAFSACRDIMTSYLSDTDANNLSRVNRSIRAELHEVSDRPTVLVKRIIEEINNTQVNNSRLQNLSLLNEIKAVLENFLKKQQNRPLTKPLNLNYLRKKLARKLHRVDPYLILGTLSELHETKLLRNLTLLGLDINCTAIIRDRTILMDICDRLGEDEKACKALLDAGANINAQDEHGNTALHFAAKQGHQNIVALLLRRGAQVDVREGSNKYTPLHVATLNRHTSLISLLLKAGADINAQDENGNTALHLAAKFGEIEVFKHLFFLGANPDIANNNGDKPIDVNYHDRDEIQQILSSRPGTLADL